MAPLSSQVVISFPGLAESGPANVASVAQPPGWNPPNRPCGPENDGEIVWVYPAGNVWRCEVVIDDSPAFQWEFIGGDIA